ncbi:Mbeg1-like protein [Olsenella massiliensis]|uniref:Mbeg1-like protein n=1 Tax=Olsenella massiliensis TaxID=1622075 RepID=UPI00071DFF2E|nr:Mbeg1-like protein [Olsenella massiliensis]
MPNMTDYLRWRGDLRFDERPFNEVDALVLATASYLDLARVVPPRGSCSTLGDACAQILAEAQGDLSPFVRSLANLDVEFVSDLATSRRFGTLRLSGCVDVVDESRALQFAAMCVELPEALVVAFRGTDSTPNRMATNRAAMGLSWALRAMATPSKPKPDPKPSARR